MVCRKVEDGVLSSMALLIIDKTGLGRDSRRDERWLAVQGVGMLEFWQNVFKSLLRCTPERYQSVTQKYDIYRRYPCRNVGRTHYLIPKVYHYYCTPTQIVYTYI